MSKKRRRAGLSAEDLEIWERVARTATPLEARPSRPLDDLSKPKTVSAKDTPQSLSARSAFRVGEAVRHAPHRHQLAPTLENTVAAMPLRMDKKAFGRLKRGKLKPERKLDLHGMTLAQAHPELIRFVSRAHADGCRLVLVVTGKGRSGRDEGGPIPTPRGVLRHQVPGWLHSAPLRPYVLQVTDAHIRHGGGGAYYVYLTRH